MCFYLFLLFFFFKQKTADEMRISDWSSDVCSSDLDPPPDLPESVDLVGKAAVVTGVILLDVGKPAVDVAEARLDIAGRCGRVAPHALPEFRFLGRTIEREGFRRAHPSDHPVGDQRPG